MQNFVRASKLAGNTQNRPAIPKNITKTLKTEQKQSMEARRSLTASETTKLAGIRQTMPGISITTTTDPIDDYKTAIQHQFSCCPNKPGSSAATFGTKHHRPGRPNNTTDHQKQTFFSPTGRCSGLHKTRKKKTTTEFYEGIAHVG
jgi:hypothetical protein